MDVNQLGMQLMQLSQRVEFIYRILQMKVLGNDISTNFGINGGSGPFGGLTGPYAYTANGSQTTINEEVDPLTGHAMGVKVQDVSALDLPYAAISAYDIYLARGVPAITAWLSQDLNGGNLDLLNDSGSSIGLHTTGAGFPPQLSISNGVNTLLFSNAGVNIDAAGFFGTHAQNVGISDTPTFADVVASSGGLNALYAIVANLADTVANIDTRISMAHQHDAGSYEVGGVPVTGDSGAMAL